MYKATNTVDVFIANDGRVFNTAQECIDWENKLTLRNTSQVINFVTTPCGDTWYLVTNETEVYWFRYKAEIPVNRGQFIYNGMVVENATFSMELNKWYRYELPSGDDYYDNDVTVVTELEYEILRLMSQLEALKPILDSGKGEQ